jgi:hypothetical protein
MATLFFNDMTNLSITDADRAQPGSPRAPVEILASSFVGDEPVSPDQSFHGRQKRNASRRNASTKRRVDMMPEQIVDRHPMEPRKIDRRPTSSIASPGLSELG